jgi:hypothetical protein
VVLRSCFRNLLVLNIPNTDPMTAEEYSDDLGEREFIRDEKSRAYNWHRGNTVTHTKPHVRERPVMPSEILKLPGLTGYVKLAGDYPIGKVRLTPRDHPDAIRQSWSAEMLSIAELGRHEHIVITIYRQAPYQIPPRVGSQFQLRYESEAAGGCKVFCFQHR